MVIVVPFRRITAYAGLGDAVGRRPTRCRPLHPWAWRASLEVHGWGYWAAAAPLMPVTRGGAVGATAMRAPSWPARHEGKLQH